MFYIKSFWSSVLKLLILTFIQSILILFFKFIICFENMVCWNMCSFIELLCFDPLLRTLYFLIIKTAMVSILYFHPQMVLYHCHYHPYDIVDEHDLIGYNLRVHLYWYMKNLLKNRRIQIFIRKSLCWHYLFNIFQKQKDKQLERKKCLARDLSDLIVYAVAVPFDLDSKTFTDTFV